MKKMMIIAFAFLALAVAGCKPSSETLTNVTVDKVSSHNLGGNTYISFTIKERDGMIFDCSAFAFPQSRFMKSGDCVTFKYSVYHNNHVYDIESFTLVKTAD